MNERMARMEQKVENIKEAVDRIEAALTSHIQWEDTKYEEMNKKYSGKWVEKVVVALVIAAISSIIYAIK